MKESVVTWANLITVSRLVFAGFFITSVLNDQYRVAVAYFVVAWVLDAVDGWIARALHQETSFGFYLDKVVDRLLIVGGIFFLVTVSEAPPLALLILTKDLAMVPALTIHAAAREPIASAGLLGKAGMALQGLALVWLLFHWPYVSAMIIVVAVLGAVLGGTHLYRVAFS